MFEVVVQCRFQASHALLIRGQREEAHEHDWRVRVGVVGDRLDEDGLLCDFHDLERCLLEIVEPFQGADLNRVPPFDRVNPTAERVGEYIGLQMVERFSIEGVLVSFVEVMEAVDCVAVWRKEVRGHGVS